MTVEIDNLEFDDYSDNVFQNTFYEGKPFTGVAVDHREDGGYEEWHFIEGFGEGRCFSTFPDGSLQEEYFLQHGHVISEKEWTSDGILVLDHTEDPFSYKEYYNDGVLKCEQTKEFYKMWYPSGALKQEFIFSQGYSTQYARDGAWIYRIVGNDLPLTLSRDYLTINEDYVSRNYLELLTTDRRFMWYFLLWLPEKPETADNEVPHWVSEVICNMINSDDLNVRDQGIILAREYFVKAAIPLLERESKCRKKPQDIFEDNYNVGYTFTIGKQAKISLQQLKSVYDR